MRDEIFKFPGSRKHFKFNEQVSRIFDDMAARSIPFYKEGQRMAVEICKYFLSTGDTVCDIGCSTGNTLIEIAIRCKAMRLKFFGIDGSKAMIQRATEKATQFKETRSICFKTHKLESWQPLAAKAYLLQYTLQFLPLLKRADLLGKCQMHLQPGGVLFLCEKVGGSILQKEQEAFYSDFKRRNGYSELEIAQKREALENILHPLSWEENLTLLKKAGFKKAEIVFKWYNFAFFLARK